MLVIDDISLRVAGRLLIERATAQIPDGARVGLVGRNGTGKSTLFRAIAGDIAVEHGSFARPARASLGQLPQEAPSGPERLIDLVLAGDRERTFLIQEAETATDPHRIAEIQSRLADIGAHAAPARAAGILAGLGFSHADQQRACAEFSGGWRMRVALAAVLFAEPDLLLLDEPTNYLDLEGTLWLEDHIARYPRTVIVISHDRDLLDSAVDSILHLERAKLTFYRGNYTSFERQRNERLALDESLARKQEAQRRHLTAFVERFRAKASKARQAQSRLKLLAKMQPIDVLVEHEARAITIPSPEKPLSPPIIALDDMTVGYEPGRPVLRRLTLRIDADDRIALLGANGNGKSTLTKLLTGRLAPFSGTMTRAERLKVAYFAQHQLDELNPQASAYDHVRRLMPDAPEARVRARVGGLGFPATMADTKVAHLSGGEKTRLLLGLATFEGPDLVVLDEPTNHLDIDSRAALIEGINDYSGAVILVSHDRFLLETCVERLWLVANGEVNPFEGDLDDYRRLVLGGSAGLPAERNSAAEGRTTRADLRRAAAEKRSELAPLKRRIDEFDKTIAMLTKKIDQIDAILADAQLYGRDPSRVATLSKERAAAASALAAAEDRWLALSAQYESAMADS
ncbi:MAG TPA: ABC-F family ATP-binding cassette domain-containing protein [Xanthobacteraceae bacterium]|nr:ABC-F family ATP-binding cassette domain-containing protein [Xanthobacteraceae bacterium]